MTEIRAWAEDSMQVWSSFLEAWPPARVREMTLDEYTNPGKDDAFIYWIESRLDKLGSIWGGSAFKFGIYHRDRTEEKEASGGRIWGEKYAWLSKLGQTEQDAFAKIHERIIEVIDAAQVGNFERIDEIELAPTLKWKVAFLYQDREQPVVFPIFMKKALFHHYQAIDPTAKMGTTPYSVMYAILYERHKDLGDVFKMAYALWKQWEEDKEPMARAWALPVGWTLDADAVEELCSKEEVSPEDVDSVLENLLSGADLSAGDHLAVLVQGNVRAVGTLTSVEPGEFAWKQTSVSFPSGLLVNPTSEIKELDAAEWQEIWSQVPKPDETAETEKAAKGPRYWKIAPGSNAVAWDEWRDKGMAAIGWSELGDLTGLSREEFDARTAECQRQHGYRKGMNQVWSFRNIRPGDRVVANQGTHTALGIGTVTGGYRFVTSEHIAEDEGYPHQIQVHWDDVTPRKVQQAGWRRTLLELDKNTFEALVSQQEEAEAAAPKKEPAAPPCEPQNIILYGPPGTGKTYSTVRRALELILGPEKLEGLSERGLVALFREHQTRGQIEFVTFHQAYGYEEFVEGLRPVLGEADSQNVRYELHDGVFKRIALRAAAEGLRTPTTAPDFEELWNRFGTQVAEEDELVAKSQSGKAYVLKRTDVGSIRIYSCDLDDEGNVTSVADKGHTASQSSSRVIWENREQFGTEIENLSYEELKKVFARARGGGSGNAYTPLWIVYGQLLALSRSRVALTEELVDKRARVQQALDKPSAGGASFSFSTQSRQYVLIIDEINRGNVSKILGELITLLEPDKRLGARTELKLPLSYSPTHRFAVPPNLHVLGTMNTADRSIALMDVALRRRFSFEELMPSSSVIRDVLSKKVPDAGFIDLVVDIFDTLNDRIRFLYDRDHQLGHSYFLDVEDMAGLRRVFMDRVIPLMQEYFYGAWDKICTVLGCPYDEAGEPKRGGHVVSKKDARRVYVAPIVRAETFPEVRTLGFDHDEYEDRVDFAVMRGFRDGRMSHDDLTRTFLGVLHLKKEEFEERLATLTANEADAHQDDVALESSATELLEETEIAS